MVILILSLLWKKKKKGGVMMIRNADKDLFHVSTFGIGLKKF